MEESKKRGGTRKGSGRKASTNPKKPLTFYIEEKIIEQKGGEDSIREIVKSAIYDNWENPVINAARGRDESGINEDEVTKESNAAPKTKNLSNPTTKRKRRLK